MTTIYIVPNLADKINTYICDSQETINIAPESCKPTCIVGGETEANTLLDINQQAWLTQQAILFTVNLQTVVEGGIVWTIIDLSTQLPNTDGQYFVLDPTTGLYTEAIGLDAAKTLFLQTQQTYLAFTNMNKYIEKNAWGIPPQ